MWKSSFPCCLLFAIRRFAYFTVIGKPQNGKISLIADISPTSATTVAYIIAWARIFLG
jgi:hypothetical protein